MEVKLGEQEREALRARYERCLCRACLESLAQSGEGGKASLPVR